MKFGSEMRKARKHHGVSLRALAKALGYTVKSLTMIDRGRFMPNRNTVSWFESKIGAEPGSLVAAARYDVGQFAMELWDNGTSGGWTEACSKARDEAQAHAKFLEERKAREGGER
jgi:transcriptional regulator with XRE-family HTH domain